MGQKKLRVAIIGAGMAGLLAAIKLKSRGDTEVVVYEKADRIGGTWRENTYPGLTCDVPSHHYTYSFERNPDWTRHLPPGQEIQHYFERTCKKYELDALIRFGEEICSCSYDGTHWQLETRNGTRDQADAVIAATGVLHHPKWPDIPGQDRFRGALFHTARWDHSIDLSDKRVAVIGNGSTGVQIISGLAGKVRQLFHFQRTAQWIMPVENGHFDEEQRRAFRDDPALLAEVMNVPEYTAAVERYTQAIIDIESDGAREMADICRQNLEHSVTDPELRRQLTPDHKPLCKRLIFSPDYYQAIQHAQSRLVTTGIAGIEETGIRTADGQLHEVDVIALATGFQTDRFMRPMGIVGLNGTTLDDHWPERPVAYRAISLPDFPNFFMLNGPNGPVGNFSLIDIAEHQWHYIEQLLEEIRSGRCRSLCASAGAMESFEQQRAEAAMNTVWAVGGCNSWYLDAKGIPASWPWNYSAFVQSMQSPRLEDFVMH